MRGYMKATAALAAFALLVVVMGLGAQNTVQAAGPSTKFICSDGCNSWEPTDANETEVPSAEDYDNVFTISYASSGNAKITIQNLDLVGNTDETMTGNNNPKTVVLDNVLNGKATIVGLPLTTDLVDPNKTNVYLVRAFNGNRIQISYTPGDGKFADISTVSVDNVKPSLVVTSPASPHIVGAGANVTFSAEFTDSGAGFSESNDVPNGDAVSLTVAGNKVGLTSGNFTELSSGWRLTRTMNSSSLKNIAANVPWYIEVEDKAGNTRRTPGSIESVTTGDGTDQKTIVDDTFKGNWNTEVFKGSQIEVAISTTVDGVTTTKNEKQTISSFKDGTFTVENKFSQKIPPLKAYKILATNLITVDTEPPVVTGATTGHAWKSDNKGTARLLTGKSGKSNSIKVVFRDDALEEKDGRGSGVDSATVTPSAFAVSGTSVESVLTVDAVGTDASNGNTDVVFLTLDGNLGSSEKPTVSVASNVIRDKAGNASSGGRPTVGDGLGPNLTLSRDAALSNSKVTVTITTDEQLNDDPSVKVHMVTDNDGTTAPGNVCTTRAVTALSYTCSLSIGGGTVSGEYSIVATGEDTQNDNEGSVGSTNAAASSAFTFELDNKFNGGDAPTVEIGNEDAKSSKPGPDVEAVDPMIVTISYNNEAKEYKGDSYSTVELVSASLKVGTAPARNINLANEVSSQNNKRFTLPVLNPQVGEYKLTIEGQDTAGNSKEHILYWTVITAKAVPIQLVPGWNLISLPFQPGNPAINSVVPANHPADIVMTYDNVAQVWLVSRRDSETGLFTGDIAVMTANTAYFIRTDKYQDLSVLRPPVATAAAPPPPPPAVSVGTGWNLVPVISLAVPTPDFIPADTYFGTLAAGSNAGWLKALTFDPLTRTWASVTPGETEVNPDYDKDDASKGGETRKVRVEVGKGYWLYATSAGVIIP